MVNRLYLKICDKTNEKTFLCIFIEERTCLTAGRMLRNCDPDRTGQVSAKGKSGENVQYTIHNLQ